ncbi:MAG: iron-only hydrogenase system regulator [Oscillospiraceae bacterium]|nr:iron-only hydrogenase system regulator [Oscillospiraceae bacterium]
METRIAAISLIVEEPASVEALNGILHEYAPYVLGRMGIPYREKGVNIICVAVDAPQNAINALTGKLGRLSGVSAKAVYSRSEKTEETNRRIKNENC